MQAEFPFTIGYYDNPWDSIRSPTKSTTATSAWPPPLFNLVHGVGYDQGVGALLEYSR